MDASAVITCLAVGGTFGGVAGIGGGIGVATMAGADLENAILITGAAGMWGATMGSASAGGAAIGVSVMASAATKEIRQYLQQQENGYMP